MKIQLESNIIKHYLRNVYFINGTAYAGKSTMVKMLAEKHNMIFCGENYHHDIAVKVKTPDVQPALCYFQTMSGWDEYVNRTPDEFLRWYDKSSQEAAEFEIAYLISLAQDKKVIVDTNISTEILHEISDYDHVAIMLSPQSMSSEQFFNREDEEKQFILEQINKCENPEKTLANFKECIARVNSPQIYEDFKNSGFFCVVRENSNIDTKLEVLSTLEKHFKLC